MELVVIGGPAAGEMAWAGRCRGLSERVHRERAPGLRQRSMQWVEDRVTVGIAVRIRVQDRLHEPRVIGARAHLLSRPFGNLRWDADRTQKPRVHLEPSLGPVIV